MNAFTMTDSASRAQRLAISWECLTHADDNCGAPDENDEGFWPSLDPESPGWIGENPAKSFESQMRSARGRMAAFKAGSWGYVGVVARAVIHIPIGGQSFRVMTLDSAGLWGVESNSGAKYIASVYADEKAGLLDELKTMATALLAGDFDEESE